MKPYVVDCCIVCGASGASDAVVFNGHVYCCFCEAEKHGLDRYSDNPATRPYRSYLELQKMIVDNSVSAISPPTTPMPETTDRMGSGEKVCPCPNPRCWGGFNCWETK